MILQTPTKASFVSALLVASLVSFGASAASQPPEPKSGSARLLKAANISGIVSETDASKYRVIFDLQENGEWRAADKIIKSLDDDILMGHVLAQKYLHPTKYRSRYKELKAWLDKYNDHPQAKRLYNLALKRRPKNWKMPEKPTGRRFNEARHGSGEIGFLAYNPRKKLSKAESQERRGLERRMRYYLRKGWTKSYKKLVRDKRVVKLFHPVELDRTKARLAQGYYGDNRDEWAYDWANAAVKRSGKYLPEAHWTAALAAWRLNKFDTSRKHFEAVSKSKYSSPWLVSAGAFWAARASIRIRQPGLYNDYLRTAASFPRTFYGIMAHRLLGSEIKYNWAPPPLEKEALNQLSNAPGGQRTVALLQIGEDRRAERELRMLFSSANPELARAMMALADRADMPSLAMRIGSMLVASGSKVYDSTAYPAPALPTKDGEVIDRALVLALIRQESGFNPKAKSHRGARGLMQLMPSTASYVAKDRKLKGSKRNRDALFDPATNLELGQKYIDILMSDKRIKGDLFRMVTAWNGGPGNLNKWTRKVKHNNDPLLFIESIPARETRIFVERVLTNYWIYQARFNNPTPSLDKVASGNWPTYQSENDLDTEVAEDQNLESK